MTPIILQNISPDEFFTAAQQRRLAELLAKRRAALDAGRQIDPVETVALEALIDAELDGATRRAAAMMSGQGS
jgi:hypothetical protein